MNASIVIKFIIVLTIIAGPGTSYCGFWSDVKEGFIGSFDCNLKAEILPTTKYGEIPGKTLLTNGPNKACKKIAAFQNNSRVKIIGQKNNWYFVEYSKLGNVYKGWIKKDIITLEETSNESHNESVLDKPLEASRTDSISRPMYPKDMVRNVQKVLNKKGYDAGVEDGIYGRGTKAAVELFQYDVGLEVSGNLDPKTIAKLNESQNIKLQASKKDKKTNAVNGIHPSNENMLKSKAQKSISNSTVNSKKSNTAISTLFKIKKCSTASSVSVYVNKDVRLWDDGIAKSLLLQGAKHRKDSCPNDGTMSMLDVFIGYKTNSSYPLLTRLDSNTQVSATFTIDSAYKLDKYVNYKNHAKEQRQLDLTKQLRKKNEEERIKQLTDGDYVFENISCGGNNRNYVYVLDTFDTTDDENVQELLGRAAEYGKIKCSKKGYVYAYIHPISRKNNDNKKNWHNEWASAGYYNNKELKRFSFNNKEGTRRKRKAAQEKAQKKRDAERLATAVQKVEEDYHTRQSRRMPLIAFYKKSEAAAVADVKKLLVNPYVHENNIVVIDAVFISMLDKNSAIFTKKMNPIVSDGFFIANNIPSTRFTEKKHLLLAARVLGNKRKKLPSGKEILSTQVSYIDAYEGNYQSSDISWLKSQKSNEMLVGEWREICNDGNAVAIFMEDGTASAKEGNEEVKYYWEILGKKLKYYDMQNKTGTWDIEFTGHNKYTRVASWNKMLKCTGERK
jgi:hypothetical protein